MGIDSLLTNFTALDLLSWYEEGALELSPKFQRRPVWSPAARSYFVDSLLREFPVPPIHVRLFPRGARKVGREIVDGQQRLHALFDFIDGRFDLSQSAGMGWSGQTFDQLTLEQRSRLLYYKFHVYQYQNVDDATILEIFARLNTYSVSLNRQELRNGMYFGYFKTQAYEIARRHLAFWRSTQIVSETDIARMAEVELVSELLVLILDGMQDRKTTLDEFYGQLDEGWESGPGPTWSARGSTHPLLRLSRAESAERFETTLEQLAEAVGSSLRESEFRKPPFFYTLFAITYHRIFGLPSGSVELPTPKRPLDSSAARRLVGAMEELSALMSGRNVNDASLRPWQREFLVSAATKRVDSIDARSVRFHTLWRRARLSEQ